MTAFERFDPFEQRVSDALVDIAAPRRPDYIDDILRQTARTSQRPRWSFFGRWLPMDNVYPRTVRVGRASLSSMVIIVFVALLAALAVFTVVGALNRVPPPFGPARNGEILLAKDGQIFSAKQPGDAPVLLVGSIPQAVSPVWSPDGKRFFFGAPSHGEGLYVADADGSHIRLVVDSGLALNAVWAPDSQTLAVKDEEPTTSWLLLVHADGSPATRIGLGKGVFALGDLAFRPPDGKELLVRAQRPDNHTALLLVDLQTLAVKDLGLPSDMVFGKEWDLGGAAWSPDGTRFAYNVVEPLPDATPAGHFRVHVANADGSGDVALPGPDDPTVQENWPIFSPDGKWILVHRWTWKSSAKPEGWLAVMPADGSAPAHDIGPRIPGGEDTGLIKTWSPDGTRILMRTGNTQVVYSIDPLTGTFDQLAWSTTELPDWQRLAP